MATGDQRRILDLSTTCTCPSCFNVIDLDQCKILSGITSGKELKKPPKGLFSALKGVPPLNGSYYTRELAHRECYECQYLLPSNIERVPSVTLVVIGDPFSGKSHYIAALIQQLKAEWISNSTGFVRFTCLTQDVEKTYIRDCFEPLFTHKKILPPTQRGTSQYATPLIYELATSPSPKRPTMVTNLMIYDTSGEDFEDENRVVEFARFALKTNAFIFVADPFTMQPFFNSLHPKIQIALRGRKAAERLNSIIAIYERNTGKTPGGSLPGLPIAVMVSKSDMFKSLYNPRAYSFMTNPTYRNGIDLRDSENIDKEVRNLLTLPLHRQGDLLAATNNFQQVRFFATSSTGEPPDVNGDFANVSPCRCPDPVLWILYQLGIISANR